MNFSSVYGIDEEGRISLQIWFDLEDMDAAIAELDAAHARFEDEAHRQARSAGKRGESSGRSLLDALHHRPRAGTS